MAPFARLQKLINQSIRQSAEESSMLLGENLQVSDTDYVTTNRMSYFADMEESVFVVGVESRANYPGCFFMVFALRDAIAMSGTLLGIPPARISQKRTLLILEADDTDAFSEIANLIIGSFNSVFQPGLSGIHLKQLPATKFIPQVDEMTDSTPVPDGEYLLCRTGLELHGHDMNRLDILIPIALANLFDPQEPAVSDDSVDDAEAASIDGLESSTAETALGKAAVLILEDDALERQQVEKALAGTGFAPIAAALNANINELLAGNQVKAVLLGMNKGSEQEFSQCIRINAVCEQHSLPVIVSAGQWTRTGVLRAVKSGARDVLLKPYDTESLVERIGKFLHAA